jgi:aminoglycoside 6'-N-acetyltransferase
VRADHAFTELTTERLRLRRSEPGDAEAIASYRSLPEVHRTQGWERTDAEHIRGEIEAMAARAPGEPGGWTQFTVETRNGGEIVGDVGLSPAEDAAGTIKVGYTIAPAHQRRGYASEAVAALVEYAFTVLDADAVRAYADAGNVASTRVMEKVGMRLIERFEGTEDDGTHWTGVRYERERGEG